MIHIRHTSDSGYVVYDQRDFENHHAHTKSFRIAKIIKSNILNHRLPKSKDIRLIESHIRVASDKDYINQLQSLVEDIKKVRNQKKYLLQTVMKEKEENLKRDREIIGDFEIERVDKLYQTLILLIENSYYQPNTYRIYEHWVDLSYSNLDMMLYKNGSSIIRVGKSTKDEVSCNNLIETTRMVQQLLSEIEVK